MIQKNIRYFIFTALMLCMGVSAWSTTYYAYGGSSSNPTEWSTTYIASTDDLSSFSWDASGLSTNTTYYVGITTKSTGYASGGGCVSSQLIYDGGGSRTGNIKGVNNRSEEIGTYYYSTDDGTLRFAQYQITASSSTVTLSLRRDGEYGGAPKYLFDFGTAVSGFAVTSSVSANGSITPSGSNNVSSSQTYSVSLNTGYKVSSVTNSTGGSLSPTELELVGMYGDFSVTLNSPQNAGALTINTTSRTPYRLDDPEYNGATSNISPSGEQTVYDGDAITYVVTPSSGHVFKSREFTGSLKSGTAIVRSGDTFTFYPASAGKFSVVYGSATTNTPIARIGNRIDVNASNDVIVSAYVTSDECYSVDEIEVFYSNNSGFRNEGSMMLKSKTFSPVSPATSFALNNAHSLTLLANEVEAIVGHGETLYVRIKAHNANGYSAYSDVVSLVYNSDEFWHSPVELLTANACDGSHEFDWSSMFLPTPTDFSVVEYGTTKNSKSEFTITPDGKMVWNVISSIANDGTVNIKQNGTYKYTFTAKRSGYTPQTETLTIMFNTTGTADEISGIYLNGSGSPVSRNASPIHPWDTSTLSATESSAAIESIGWTVSPVSNNYILTPEEGTSVLFKSRTSGEYTIRARGLTSTCGSSKSKTIKLNITKDSEPCVP